MVRSIATERDSAHTLESLMAVVFVYENIIYRAQVRLDCETAAGRKSTHSFGSLLVDDMAAARS